MIYQVKHDSARSLRSHDKQNHCGKKDNKKENCWQRKREERRILKRVERPVLAGMVENTKAKASEGRKGKSKGKRKDKGKEKAKRKQKEEEGARSIDLQAVMEHLSLQETRTAVPSLRSGGGGSNLGSTWVRTFLFFH